ncbi:hypothetical protein C1I89_33700 [Achromobacter pulmonis]|uniref:Uncharacterized protein n=1 Tax=Achromobacter pulmonis TaxID=1389932 RepID=A0A2N8K855_9BURK|nr:hypothetical protein [Achromobacter pulmonis]PND29633.1 hypothetical protein C1I89_33700 [Achromobacter pulmonis]
MATRKSPQPCLVTIGYTRLLMPAEQGMAMLKLLQHAVECELETGAWPPRYQAGTQPRVEFELVKASQISVAPEHVEPVSRTRKNLLLEG